MATTQTPRRRIRVRKAIPADAEIIGKIHDDAFASSVMSRLMFPKGPSADASAKFIASLFPAENPDRPPDPREVILMVAELLPEGADDDLASGEVVAFAKWVAVREELPESVWNVVEPVTAEAIGEGVDLEVFNAFIGGLHKIRRERLKGNPILLLRILACDPAHARLGAGTALLQWGAEFADREGLKTWLESSPAGYSVYRRCGYKDMGVQDLPISELYGAVNSGGEDWGSSNAADLAGPAADGVHRCVMMMREPNKA